MPDYCKQITIIIQWGRETTKSTKTHKLRKKKISDFCIHSRAGFQEGKKKKERHKCKAEASSRTKDFHRKNEENFRRGESGWKFSSNPKKARRGAFLDCYYYILYCMYISILVPFHHLIG
jgi:hypothetical protein